MVMVDCLFNLSSLLQISHMCGHPRDRDASSAIDESFPFMNMWKSKVPEKCKFFLCTTVHEGILTIVSNIDLKIFVITQIGALYVKKSNESTNHLFLHCLFVKSSLSKVKDLTGWTNNALSLRDLCKHIF